MSLRGVQWGKYLRVKVNIDTTRKLIRRKKVCIEGNSGRWVFFKYAVCLTMAQKRRMGRKEMHSMGCG